MAGWFFGYPCDSCQCVQSVLPSCGDTIYCTLTISSPYFETVFREYTVDKNPALPQAAQPDELCIGEVGGWGVLVNDVSLENATSGYANVTGDTTLQCYRGLWRVVVNIGTGQLSNTFRISRTDCAGQIYVFASNAYIVPCLVDPCFVDLSSAMECPDLPLSYTFSPDFFASVSPYPTDCPEVQLSAISITLDMSFAP